MPYVNGAVSIDNGYGILWDDILRGKNLDAIKYAKREAKSQDLYIVAIPQDPDRGHKLTEDELNKSYDMYMGMTKPFRRRADWITLNYLGLNNQQLYDFAMQDFYKAKKITDEKNRVFDGNAATSYDDLHINESYIPDHEKIADIDMCFAGRTDMAYLSEIAQEWIADTGIVIVDPWLINDINQLEEVWQANNAMVKRHRLRADQKSVDLWGLTCQEIYLGLKKKLERFGQDRIFNPALDDNYMQYRTESTMIRDYIFKVIKEGDISNYELTTVLANQYNKPELYDRAASKKLINTAIDYFETINNVPSAEFDYTDLPAYEPDDMIDMGVTPHDSSESDGEFSGDIIPSTIMEKWFAEYYNFFETGIMTDEYVDYNKQRIVALDRLFRVPYSRNDKWKHEVSCLGWDPNIEFNEENRATIDRVRNLHFKEMVNYYSFVDVSHKYFQEAEVEININEKQPAKIPIYIVLMQGNSPIAKNIQKATGTIYSHAMISLDPSLTRCFSFGIGDDRRDNGFIIESIRSEKKHPKNHQLKVYTTFVTPESFDTIQKNITWFIEHQRQTLYGYKNLITYLFKIPYERDTRLMCSQFVDRMLKLGKIDFTKTTSSLVSPGDLDNAAKKSKKIYKVYEGTIGDYKEGKVAGTVTKLSSKAKTFNESTKYLTPLTYLRLFNENASMYECVNFNECDEEVKFIHDALLKPIYEAKEAPIQIERNGDLEIKNPKFSPAADYASSHKMLQMYAKNLENGKEGSLDGIKSELARQWSDLLYIEAKLYGKSIMRSTKRKEFTDTRAHIIADYKKYLPLVLEKEPDFDFQQYYLVSPYARDTYVVKGSTIDGIIKILKKIK